MSESRERNERIAAKLVEQLAGTDGVTCNNVREIADEFRAKAIDLARRMHHHLGEYCSRKTAAIEEAFNRLARPSDFLPGRTPPTISESPPTWGTAPLVNVSPQT